MTTLIASGWPFEARDGCSRAVVAGGFVFVAVATGHDIATMTMPEGAVAQAGARWPTIRTVPDEAGSSRDRVVGATIDITGYAEPAPAVYGRVLA